MSYCEEHKTWSKPNKPQSVSQATLDKTTHMKTLLNIKNLQKHKKK